MTTYYGTASGFGQTAGVASGVQSLANPGLNGKVKALQCKITIPATDIVEEDTIVFGQIPPGSVIIGQVAKWGDMSTGSATLTLCDGSIAGTALSPDNGVHTAQSSFAADYTKIGTVVTNGLVVGKVGAAHLTQDGTTFEAYLLYASPQ